MIRLSLRMRLTLVYSALFAVASVALLATSYGLTDRNLPVRVRLDSVDAQPPVPGTLVTSERLRLGPDGAVERWVVVAGEPDLAFEVPAAGEALFAERVDRLVTTLRQRTLATLVRQSGVAFALMLVLSLGLGWIVAGRALRPVHRITGIARRLSHETLGERIALQGPRDELKELADTFDAMLERLQASFEAERRFAANAGHELRTPIANQRTVLEVGLSDPDASADELRAMGEKALTQVVRQERLVEGLFDLSSARQIVASTTTVDLAALVDDAVATLDLSGLTLTRDVEPAPTQGDPVLLSRLVENLLENAVRHNLPGGWITVTAAPGRLRVVNSGPHEFAQAELAGLLVPFARGLLDRTSACTSNGSRPGLGLGLAIVATVARAHGAALQLSSVPGGGLCVDLVFTDTPARELVGAATRPAER